MKLLRCVYSFLLYLLLPVALGKLLWRGRKDRAYWQQWGQRFGFVNEVRNSQKTIWVHAVSVGETIAIRPLIESLLKNYPGYQIYFTNGTINGQKRAQALFGDRVFYSYAPYDIPSMVKRFLNTIKPSLVLIMETEVWVNWLYALEQKNIPVMLVNARLSERSFLRYYRFQALFKEAWQSFRWICAQAPADAKRYALLGIAEENIKVVGNLKYNLILPEHFFATVQSWKSILPQVPTWITASTHPPEEEQLLQVFIELKKVYPTLLWLLAPRHVERSESIAKMVQKAGFSLRFRSQINDFNQVVATDVLMLDTIGELQLFYALAQVAFVGGSLVERGGHNILEAAAVGTVITCGPSMFNFAAVLAQFKAAQALVQCDTLEALTKETIALFANTTLCETYSRAAKQCFDSEQEALSNHLILIDSLLK